MTPHARRRWALRRLDHARERLAALAALLASGEKRAEVLSARCGDAAHFVHHVGPLRSWWTYHLPGVHGYSPQARSARELAANVARVLQTPSALGAYHRGLLRLQKLLEGGSGSLSGGEEDGSGAAEQQAREPRAPRSEPPQLEPPQLEPPQLEPPQLEPRSAWDLLPPELWELVARGLREAPGQARLACRALDAAVCEDVETLRLNPALVAQNPVTGLASWRWRQRVGDLARLLRRARGLRRLVLHQAMPTPHEARLLHLLSGGAHSGAVLLRELHSQMDGAQRAELAERVRAVELHAPRAQGEDAACAQLAALAALSPGLESLDLEVARSDLARAGQPGAQLALPVLPELARVMARGAPVRALEQLAPALRRAELDGLLDDRDVSHLGRLGTLEALRVVLRQEGRHSGSQLRQALLELPRLRELWVVCRSSSNGRAVRVADLLPAPAVRRVRLERPGALSRASRRAAWAGSGDVVDGDGDGVFAGWHGYATEPDTRLADAWAARWGSASLPADLYLSVDLGGDALEAELGAEGWRLRGSHGQLKGALAALLPRRPGAVVALALEPVPAGPVDLDLVPPWDPEDPALLEPPLEHLERTEQGALGAADAL